MPKKKDELKEFKPLEEIEAFQPKRKLKGKRKRNALFIERFLAFFIDTLIISFVCVFISMPFINSDELESIQDKKIKVENKVEDAAKETAKNKDYKKFVNEYKESVIELSEIEYESSKVTGVETFILIVVEMLYFILFQLYNNGQTLGKKLLKIRVQSTNSDKLTPNQMLFRAMIINSILLTIIDFGFMIFSNKYLYFPSMMIFNMIQNIVIIITVFMVMFRKDTRGLHDLLCRTEVVKE